MKKLLLLSISVLFGLNSVFAQDDIAKYGAGTVPFVDGKPQFTIVENMAGKTADQLYAQAKLMCAEMFKSAKDVIQLDDPTNHIIVAKGVNKVDKSDFLNKQIIYVNFTLKIFCKEGRYKVDLTDFNNSVHIDANAPIHVDGCDITDEGCLKQNGECKKVGLGFHRRQIIDTKDLILSTFVAGMAKDFISTQDDW